MCTLPCEILLPETESHIVYCSAFPMKNTVCCTDCMYVHVCVCVEKTVPVCNPVLGALGQPCHVLHNHRLTRCLYIHGCSSHSLLFALENDTRRLWVLGVGGRKGGGGDGGVFSFSLFFFCLHYTHREKLLCCQIVL